jgi:protein gp37
VQFANGHPQWTGKVELIESKLEEPLRWRTPKRIFVDSMSDLWHEKLPVAHIASVYAVMRLAHWHTYQVLTKRPEVRLRAFKSTEFWALVERSEEKFADLRNISARPEAQIQTPWIWEAVSVEDQKTADERIPLLLQTPAALRFVSYEPALGPVDFHLETYPEGAYLDWVIVGGESGPGARPMHPDWVRSVRDQCKAAGVPFFFKQWGAYRPADAERSTVTTKDGEVLDSVKFAMPSHVGKKWGAPIQINREGVIVHDPPGQYMVRVGKKNAGALLDGREWREFPETSN